MQAHARTASIDSQAAMPESILRNRNFILLWCAYTVSALGDHLSEMAILHMQDAVHRDDSTRISAIMLFCFMLPFFLFGPAMGWLADRLPRKWLMISADAVRAVLMISLVWLFAPMLGLFEGTSWQLHAASADGTALYNPWIYSIPLFFTGVFAAMFSPSRAAMLPTLIRPMQIVRGNGLMNAMGPIATIASFVLGGILVTAYGVRVNFCVDGVTFLASACFLLFIFPPRRKRTAIDVKSRGSLREGLRYCLTHRRVLELIFFAVLFWAAASVVRSVIPALVSHVFGGNEREIGYYQGTLGIGMLAGAMLLALFANSLRSEIAVSWSLIGAGLGATWLAAVSSWKIGMVAGYVGLFVTGMFGSGILVSINALLQRLVPDCFRGRVFGVKDVLTMSGLLLATGILAIPEWHGIDAFVPWLLLVVGIVLFAFGVVSASIRLRRGRFGAAITFWRNVAEFHARFMAGVRRDGTCTIPLEGPVIVAANHTSSVDPFLLIATSPNRYPSFMIAREYAEWPIFRHLVSMIDCIPVNRTGVDTASIKASLRHLADGRMLGIFPQGRIQAPDEPLKIHEGVGMLALRSGATIVPAHISGTLYSDGVLSPFLRRQKTVVRYGEPVDLSQWKSREKDRAAYGEVAEHIMSAINALAPRK